MTDGILKSYRMIGNKGGYSYAHIMCKNSKTKVKIKIIGYFFANTQKMKDIFELSLTFS